ncbi:hypothetical protein Tco_0026354, partial [Tanacetum coccineum]
YLYGYGQYVDRRDTRIGNWSQSVNVASKSITAVQRLLKVNAAETRVTYPQEKYSKGKDFLSLRSCAKRYGIKILHTLVAASKVPCSHLDAKKLLEAVEKSIWWNVLALKKDSKGISLSRAIMKPSLLQDSEMLDQTFLIRLQKLVKFIQSEVLQLHKMGTIMATPLKKGSCRPPRNQDNRNKESSRRIWRDQAEEGPICIMAFLLQNSDLECNPFILKSFDYVDAQGRILRHEGTCPIITNYEEKRLDGDMLLLDWEETCGDGDERTFKSVLSRNMLNLERQLNKTLHEKDFQFGSKKFADSRRARFKRLKLKCFVREMRHRQPMDCIDKGMTKVFKEIIDNILEMKGGKVKEDECNDTKHSRA